MTEQHLIQNWITPHLLNFASAEIKSQQVLWGSMDKKILLIAKSIDVEADSALIKKVIGLTQDFSETDFAFITCNDSFQLTETISFFGAEKIILFGFKPNECAIYFNGINDEPMRLAETEICFFPSINKCVTDAVYKKRFAQIWLKILNTKWIQK